MSKSQTIETNSDAPAGVGLSESAVKQLTRLIEAEGGAKMLRITVNGGGCSGFTYAFDFDDSTNDDDKTFVTDGVTVVVDEASLEFIGGAVLNYVEISRRHPFHAGKPQRHLVLRLRLVLLGLLSPIP